MYTNEGGCFVLFCLGVDVVFVRIEAHVDAIRLFKAWLVIYFILFTHIRALIQTSGQQNGSTHGRVRDFQTSTFNKQDREIEWQRTVVCLSYAILIRRAHASSSSSSKLLYVQRDHNDC